MSDVSNGPGWWAASNGKWYPPDKHPDPRHAAAFDGRDLTLPDTPPTTDGPTLTGDRRATEPARFPDQPPTTEQIRVVATPVAQQLRTAPPAARLPAPPTTWRGSLEGPRPEVDRGSNRMVAVVIFLMGIAMIVGSFAPWVSFGGSHGGSQSGFDRTVGIVTIVAGLVLAAVAGILFVGVRSLILKLIILLAGVIGFIVFLVDIVDLDAEADAAMERFAFLEVDISWGIWLVGAASLTAVVAALVERSRWSVDQ
ncbi:MAG: hypothetical protein IH940_10755 [Acidobacteria bacterium]|nr:hypothetical protein [Acidobacteriota bacterium]